MMMIRKKAILGFGLLTFFTISALWVGLNYTCLHERFTSYERPPQEVFDLLGDITSADLYHYATTDNLGNTLDCLNIIEPAPGFYYGVHHYYNGTSFNVHLVNSTNLIQWTFIQLLSHESSMPVIEYVAETGEIYLAHEQWQNQNTGSPCWIKIRYYPSLAHLVAADDTKFYQTPETLSKLEGTPNFYAIEKDGNEIHLGLHFNGENGLDRVANGVLSDFHSSSPKWTTEIWTEYNEELICRGNKGHIGGRETRIINNLKYSVQEVQAVKDDWTSWNSYLYNWADGGFWELPITTHDGSV